MTQMNIVELIVTCLAADAVVQAWFHGSLFETTREKWTSGTGFFAELLDCPQCMSYWAGTAVALLLLSTQGHTWHSDMPGYASWLTVPLTLVVKSILYGFAAAVFVQWSQGERGLPYVHVMLEEDQRRLEGLLQGFREEGKRRSHEAQDAQRSVSTLPSEGKDPEVEK
jgi:hypothetical protein